VRDGGPSASSSRAARPTLPPTANRQPPTHLPDTYPFCGSNSARCIDVMWTATERASRVPVVALASSGVKTMWLFDCFGGGERGEGRG
jgi:hypothetical protein